MSADSENKLWLHYLPSDCNFKNCNSYPRSKCRTWEKKVVSKSLFSLGSQAVSSEFPHCVRQDAIGYAWVTNNSQLSVASTMKVCFSLHSLTCSGIGVRVGSLTLQDYADRDPMIWNEETTHILEKDGGYIYLIM